MWGRLRVGVRVRVRVRARARTRVRGKVRARVRVSVRDWCKVECGEGSDRRARLATKLSVW